MTRASLLAAVFLLAACSVPGLQPPSEPDRYFILEAPSGARAETAVALPPTSAASFYDTQEMVYSREPATRAYYQFNHWTERPQRAIHVQLAGRFEAAPGARKLVLRTHLDEIYHDAAQSPGTARIRLSAQLIDPSKPDPVARQVFTASAPAASYDARGAVRGFDQALGTLLDDVVRWVDSQAAK
jgi:cholesterol transport system auxiliary component